MAKGLIGGVLGEEPGEEAEAITGSSVDVASLHSGFVLDAWKMWVDEGRPIKGRGPVHLSERSVQYVSVRYDECIA